MIRFVTPTGAGLEAYHDFVLRGTDEQQAAAWRAFCLLEALAGPYGEWLFLPSQVLAEDPVLMDNVVSLKGLAREERKVLGK